MDNSDLLTPIRGYTIDSNWAVYGEDFSIAFIPPYSLKEEKNIQSQDGFIWMETEDEIVFAIHIGRALNSAHAFLPNDVDAIIEYRNASRTDLPILCSELCFFGGTLNCLFDEGRNVDLNAEDKRLCINSSREMEYNILDDKGKIIQKITIGKRKHSIEIDSIHTADIDEVYLRISFTTPIHIKNISHYYQLITLLARFFTNQFEVGFRCVEIWSKNNELHCPDGRLFVQNSYETVDKHIPQNCMTFQDIGPNLQNLLHIFTVYKEKKIGSIPNYSLDFIPRQSTVGKMDNDIICMISGALEFEVDQYKKEFKQLKNDVIERLAKDVKQFIKDNEKNYDLDQEEFDVIKTSISNWSLSAKARFKVLAEKFNDAIEIFKDYFSKLGSFNIELFVQHRNQVMHNASIPPSADTCATAYILRGLVYCSILNRAGVPMDRITDMCRKQQINF